MRLVIRVLGLDLLDVELTTAEDQAEDDPAAALNGGSTGASPVGFEFRPSDVRWREAETPELS